MKTIFAVVFLIASNIASAYDFTVVAHTASFHPDVRTYNEVNPGVGVRVYDGGYFASVGTYKNSLSNQSNYFGVGGKVFEYKSVNFSITGGIISGYTISVMPFIIPEVEVKIVKNLSVLVNYIPKISYGDFKVDQAFGFSVMFKF